MDVVAEFRSSVTLELSASAVNVTGVTVVTFGMVRVRVILAVPQPGMFPGCTVTMPFASPGVQGDETPVMADTILHLANAVPGGRGIVTTTSLAVRALGFGGVASALIDTV